MERSSAAVSGAGLEPLCLALDNYLCLRTFFVGYSLTLADVALWGQLQSGCAVVGGVRGLCQG